ncbi:alpha-1,6-glucosidase domain-containing protein [Chitinimonas taiwanensis]|uniref:pullulanase n=1 Tax=Chitinimonas taiwanensis DSM 18899 TaxID=1121279 RepID=A0A1K2HR52_9NEIS|nr:alpha-1,6-glucosidase domain-containing protein [Chitinimonas taiwanensis]SFZ79227.1 alpha-1,6-glucosidases, pullulanase-type [Chitinimonas taiwanensis DSM 18899]
MNASRFSSSWARLRLFGVALAGSFLLSACGGGGDEPEPPVQGDIAACDATSFQSVLFSVPAAGGGGGTPPTGTSLTVHYKRLDGNYTGWQLHTWGAGKDPGWNAGYNVSSTDSFGAVYKPELAASSGSVGYLFHNGDTKDHAGADQSYTLAAGANEIWRIEGDNTTYTSNPDASGPIDLTKLRVHYKRYDGQYADWGLHFWDGAGVNVTGLTLPTWNTPAAFSSMPGYSAGASEVVFELPVLNPKDDASRTKVEFIIHGMGGAGKPSNDDKDGWSSNITVNFAGLQVSNQTADIYLVQQDAKVYTAAPDTRSVSSTDAQAYWLSKQLLKWPKVDASGVFKLYHSKHGQLAVAKDAAVSGADGALTLELAAAVPNDVATRFKFVAPGVVVQVKAADLDKLADLHTHQLLLVQETADGKVQNATSAQLAGALDDQFAGAAALNDLGVTVAGGNTAFKLWAPTAQKVMACVYDSASGKASSVESLSRDAATGVWSLSKAADLSGKYVTYLVDVFVRGTGVVRNRVTDPYSLSLSADSKRTYIADLSAANLKPADWDSTPAPLLTEQVDMSIYELHVRDFSINDSTVPEALRGKYRAFTADNSNGMKHLKALAAAGLTDVHLLPVFDIATVPETGCVNPAIPNAAADSEQQQAAIAAVKDSDCFNWGYDPYHYTAPEGSFATDANDGAKRIIEFREMVQALHKAGLRVGMDVVYNHTSSSGQNEKSVLDRIVPGYYHRLNATGGVEKSTCCDNTATENRMMAKLMIDSVLTWATQYKIDSFRFDLMAHQPRAVMEELKTKVDAATGKDIFLVGEGWNFGEVADGARFVQASQLSLNGSGIGTFSDRARDFIRGGGPFDGGVNLVRNQGYINGLFYDANAEGGGRAATDLMWAADVIKVGLAGSIRDYSLQTHWDETRQLQNIDYNGQPAGYVVDPKEVVNYVENHDNQTLFDINAYKLPLGTSKEDRARVQMLAAALNSFSQGVAYFHAGIDTLRSKSLDRNSYNSGDWFNRIDWSYTDNYFGTGAPGKDDNGDNYSVIKPLLNNANIKPGATEIAYARDVFRELMAIRASSTLFRLREAADIKARLKFYNTGSTQVPTVIVGHLDGAGYAGANYQALMYFVNVGTSAQAMSIPAESGKAYVLHSAQANGVDTRVKAAAASACTNTGTFTIPARSAVVCVVQ